MLRQGQSRVRKRTQSYWSVVNEAGNKGRRDGRRRQDPGHLEQRRQNFFLEGPHSDNFKPYGPHNLCGNSTTLPL